MTAPRLVPAWHTQEPPQVMAGWSAADLDESELIDVDPFDAGLAGVIAGTTEQWSPHNLGPRRASRGQLSWDEIVYIAKRTGVENWVGKDYNGNLVRGQVLGAPSSWRGKRGSMGTVVGCTRHHTGTPESYAAASDYPTFNVVKEGRSGLDNSLSAYGLGRWYGIYVFSEFLSWHAGSWSYAGITDGNGHFLGIEAEGAGGRWTPFQIEFYPRLVASILLYVGETGVMAPRHADGAMPRGRKSDAANLPADFMAKVAGYLANPSTLAYGAPAPKPAPRKDKDMILIRNPAGTVVLLGDNFAEWVPSSKDYTELAERLGPAADLSESFFNRLVSIAKENVRAARAIEADLADEEPPATT